MFISRLQLQFYALKILENSLFQLKWQDQQCKKKNRYKGSDLAESVF